MRLLMTPDAAQSEIRPATISSELCRVPATRNCCTTKGSESGGTISERASSMVRATNSARVWTRIVAAEVITGKNESSAEYAAPLAVLIQPSSNVATRLRRRSHPNFRRFRRTKSSVAQGWGFGERAGYRCSLKCKVDCKWDLLRCC